MGASIPRLGTYFNITSHNINALYCRALISFAPTKVRVGGPGNDPCYLYQIPIWNVDFLSIWGYGSYNMGLIPVDPRLIGVKFYMQVVCKDNPDPTWSNGLVVTIGK